MATTKAELLATAKERLANYLTAEAAILKGAQSYTIENETIERATLSKLKDTIRQLQNDIIKLENGGMRVRRAVFSDY